MRDRSVGHRVASVTSLVAAVAAVLAVVGCATSAGRTPAAALPTGVSAAPAPPAGSPSSVAAAGTAASVPSFTGTVQTIPPAMAQEMTGVSWRPGCPVPVADLRLVRVGFIGFDGAPHEGELIAHRDLADPLVRVFGTLYAARFPIRKMVRIEAYGGSDDASMADDNTSMFNCRTVPGTTKLSNHAYGRAIDVNTVENPYLPGRQVMPSAGAAYLDRRNVRPGMIVAGDVVVRAFRAEGFRWGGDWRSGTDYQHFEKPA